MKSEKYRIILRENFDESIQGLKKYINKLEEEFDINYIKRLGEVCKFILNLL